MRCTEADSVQRRNRSCRLSYSSQLRFPLALQLQRDRLIVLRQTTTAHTHNHSAHTHNRSTLIQPQRARTTAARTHNRSAHTQPQRTHTTTAHTQPQCTYNHSAHTQPQYTHNHSAHTQRSHTQRSHTQRSHTQRHLWPDAGPQAQGPRSARRQAWRSRTD